MEIVTIKDCVDYVAEDLAVAKEFLSPSNSGLKLLSIAYITIPAGVTVKKHYHLKSEETYHIVEGSGIMYLDNEAAPMVPGQAVAIIPGQWHSIHNPNKDDLVMVVTCSPAWCPEDQVFE
jgi:mannose-6-phosphate isomerase-like protein (cupin superfamily)